MLLANPLEKKEDFTWRPTDYSNVRTLLSILRNISAALAAVKVWLEVMASTRPWCEEVSAIEELRRCGNVPLPGTSVSSARSGFRLAQVSPYT
jgi:hypothetical protein